jgi:type IV pilus assembly protein PilC
MFFSPHIPIKTLAGLCRRLGIALAAGIDVRTVFAREADRARSRLREHLEDIGHAIDQGESLHNALAATGDFFPPLVRELIGVGEQTGHLDTVLAQLADHYEHLVAMRRSFLSGLALPLIELGIAIVFIGGVIWFQGILQIDVFGFGLVGNRGLVIYVATLAGAGALVWLLLRAIGRGAAWIKPLQRLMLQLPLLGQVIRTLALARLAWSMQVTLNSGMDVRRAMDLSLRSTQNAFYIDHIPTIDAEIMAGHSLHEAFCLAGGYPPDFLDTLAVGEQSGQVVESMGRLARLYLEQARDAVAVLRVIANWAVYAIIAGILIAMIFRVASGYVSAINSMMPR